MIRVVSWDTLVCHEEILMSISCAGLSNPGGVSGKSTIVGDVEVEPTKTERDRRVTTAMICQILCFSFRRRGRVQSAFEGFRWAILHIL